jgi:hypothetical protein
VLSPVGRLHDWTRSSNPAQGTVGQITQCKSRGDSSLPHRSFEKSRRLGTPLSISDNADKRLEAPCWRGLGSPRTNERLHNGGYPYSRTKSRSRMNMQVYAKCQSIATNWAPVIVRMGQFGSLGAVCAKATLSRIGFFGRRLMLRTLSANDGDEVLPKMKSCRKWPRVSALIQALNETLDFTERRSSSQPND